MSFWLDGGDVNIMSQIDLLWIDLYSVHHQGYGWDPEPQETDPTLGNIWNCFRKLFHNTVRADTVCVYNVSAI